MKRYTKRKRSGTMMVETAMVMGAVLLPLTVGILQFGIVLNATNTLTQIAREGGRYASVHGTESGSDTAIRNYVRAVAANTSINTVDLPDSRIDISMIGGAARSSGNAISVSVTYPMGKKIFIGNFGSFMSRLKGDYVAKSTFVLE